VLSYSTHCAPLVFVFLRHLQGHPYRASARPSVGEPRTAPSVRPSRGRAPNCLGQTEPSISEGGKLRARNGRLLWPYRFDFHVTIRDFLRAVNLRHGTHSFTSLPNEGMLRIFYARKKSDSFSWF
jgi:hypothetical protein